MKRRIASCLGLAMMLGCYPASTPTKIPIGIRPPAIQTGIASWYGPGFANKLMASNIPFDPESMVAAHRTLPLGTVIQVRNLRNGVTAVVKILDRGPFISGRVLDLSHSAARLLGFAEEGLTEVEYSILRLPPIKAARPMKALGKPMRTLG